MYGNTKGKRAATLLKINIFKESQTLSHLREFFSKLNELFSSLELKIQFYSHLSIATLYSKTQIIFNSIFLSDIKVKLYACNFLNISFFLSLI